MKLSVLLVCVVSLFAGCAVFKAPVPRADGPTAPTGSYDNAAEKWADESSAARRKAEKERTEKILEKIER
jgi:hypothetical protein